MYSGSYSPSEWHQGYTNRTFARSDKKVIAQATAARRSPELVASHQRFRPARLRGYWQALIGRQHHQPAQRAAQLRRGSHTDQAILRYGCRLQTFLCQQGLALAYVKAKVLLADDLQIKIGITRYAVNVGVEKINFFSAGPAPVPSSYLLSPGY